MKQSIWEKVFIKLLIIVATSIGGILLASAITPDANAAARRTKWNSLGRPPEAAVKIAGEYICGQSLGVVVQAASGMNYLSCPPEWREWNTEYSEPWYLATCQGNPPTQYSPGFESLPYPVKDCGLNYTHEWAIVETVYTVLEDGSVWQWTFTYGIGTFIAYWTGGLILGLVIGIIIAVRVWRKTQQQHTQ